MLARHAATSKLSFALCASTIGIRHSTWSLHATSLPAYSLASMQLSTILLWFLPVTLGHLCVVPPYSYTSNSDPALATALGVLQQSPIGTWVNDNGHNPVPDVLAKCDNGAVPIFIIYGLPNKDCAAGYSGGGNNKNTEEYASWLQTIVSTVGSREVIYIVEPDALGLLSQQGCAVNLAYEANLKTAVEVLSQNTNAHIYVDVAGWATESVAISVLQALKTAGRLAGISINTSNYQSNDAMLRVCSTYSSATGGLHCVIDTSRNYRGSPQNEWCNAKSAGIGAPPTETTNHELVDYYLWLKVPGESDGQCTDSGRSSDAMAGPGAGQFFTQVFTSLWNNGYYVAQGAAPIGGAPPPSTAAPVPAPPPATTAPVVTPTPASETTPAPAPSTPTPTTPTTPTPTTPTPTTPTPTTDAPKTPTTDAPTYPTRESDSDDDDYPCEIDEDNIATMPPRTTPPPPTEAKAENVTTPAPAAVNLAAQMQSTSAVESPPTLLSPGGTVAIALAVIALVALVVFSVFSVRRHRKRFGDRDDQVVALDSTGIAVLLSTPAAKL
ncbi:hypothetical protein SDRG_12168 [Saprolegnia diclina VS20]|uniref:Glycoside hydrolase n=1 Tax=Saprolegnia diclina (strain VS20) TaxID=1156394 RepID=T0PX59_SAPDV|nr:hypothetical protein SDRG_12168 [Saprolegnia diclina VS20]EQC30109.1 hypothetical protein SDRG_12168 [Saprolegnia diclina VS20]|eukprot:XP_008616452.1 hypothetical protein SDRG_12168 [Saprolegnia diclina VS20]